MRAAALLALLLLAGCFGDSGSSAEAQQGMGKAEKDRALALCQAYVDRVCACVATDPTLRDPCDLARGQPDSIRLYLGMMNGKKRLTENDRLQTEAELRKTVAACVKADSALDLQKCPRPR